MSSFPFPCHFQRLRLRFRYAVMVTLERLVAVRNPLKVGQYFKKPIVGLSIGIISVLVFISYLHYFFWAHPMPVPLCGDPKQTHYMFVAYARRHYPFRYDYVHVSTAFSGVLCVVIPILLLVIFNSLLIASLYMNRKAVATLGQSSRAAQECRVTITVVVITVTAVILLSPSFGLAVWDAYDYGRYPKPLWRPSLIYFSNFLVIIDRTSNFFLYCLSSQAFRRKFFAVLSGRFRKRDNRSQSTASTYLTRDSIHRRSTLVHVPPGTADGKRPVETAELLPRTFKSNV